MTSAQFPRQSQPPDCPPMAGLRNDACSFCRPGDERGIDVLKVDLHLHSLEIPVDVISHNAHQLIDRAAELGFDALALTLHDCDFRDPDCARAARERGIVLFRRRANH